MTEVVTSAKIGLVGDHITFEADYPLPASQQVFLVNVVGFAKPSEADGRIYSLLASPEANRG